MFRAFVVLAFLAAAVAFAPSAKWARQASLQMVSFPGATFVSGSSKLVASGASPKKSASAAASTKVVVKAGVKALAGDKVSTLNAPSIAKKFNKDMTWGGRPNPTPEMLILEDGAVDKTKLHWTLGWKN